MKSILKTLLLAITVMGMITSINICFWLGNQPSTLLLMLGVLLLITTLMGGAILIKKQIQNF